MESSKGSPGNQDYLAKSLHIAVHLSIVALILFSSLKIITPFLMPVLWGILIAVALQPLFEKIKLGLGGKSKLAGAIFIVVGLLLLIAPTVWLADSLVGGAREIGEQLEQGTFKVPPPDVSVKEWPVIGESVYKTWNDASVNLEGTATKLAPQLKALGARLAGVVAGVGAGFIQSLFAIVIAGLFLINSAGAGRTARAVGNTLAGDRGVELVDLSTATIRSVVKGVLLVAIIQSLLAAVGLVIAGVPAAGLWALLVLIVAIMQLPPILILGPIAVWVFSANDSTFIAVFFMIYSMVVSGVDGPLKAVLLGRGVKIPMVVILIGAIGGMIGAGIIGLFVGAVILSIGYVLITDWIGDNTENSAEGAAEDTPSA